MKVLLPIVKKKKNTGIEKTIYKQYFNKTKREIIKKWGNHALDNQEVHEIGKELLGDKFKGVFPSDRLEFKPGYYIINSDKSGMPGSHWLGIIIKNKTMYVYDSYARKTNKLINHLYDKAKKLKYKIVDINKKSDQKNSSQVCGPISISFLLTYNKFGIKGGNSI